MAKGAAAAKKAGDFQARGTRFEKRPAGINYFAIKDGQTATVRFMCKAEDIEWIPKWKIGEFPNQELVNVVDVHEDGTPDPGAAAGLKRTWKGYVPLIWRGAPDYQRDAEKKFVKDAQGNKRLLGYRDQVAIWECSYAVYEMLTTVDEQYRGLMSRDFKVMRKGAKTDTVYHVFPHDVDAGPQPVSPADIQLASTERIDPAQFTKPSDYTKLAAYLNGGAPPEEAPTFAQQVEQNAAAAAIDDNPFL